MNIHKKYIYIALYITLAIGISFLVYTLHAQVHNFSKKVQNYKVSAKTLEERKEIFDRYSKIIVQGSKEQQEIEKYILNSKNVFQVISDIERDAKKIGLITTTQGGIISVTSREDVSLEKLGAHELVVELRVEGKRAVVEEYIKALSHIPYVSYIEKIQTVFNEKVPGLSTGDITIVFIQSK